MLCRRTFLSQEGQEKKRKKKKKNSVSAGGKGCAFAVFFAPIPEKGISNFIAHGSIIQVFTVEEKCATVL